MGLYDDVAAELGKKDKGGLTAASIAADEMFSAGQRNRAAHDADPVKYASLTRDYRNDDDYHRGWDAGGASGSGHTHGPSVTSAGPVS
jgi:hypothetical protein